MKSHFLLDYGTYMHFSPQDYYSIPFATPTTALTGRDGSLTNNPYSGEHFWLCSWFDWFLDLSCDICVNFLTFSLPELLGDLSKFGRGDASSPAPATTLAQTQQNQSQTHHTAQQTFLNPALPPGYSYTSLPYYTGMPGLPNTFQYGPAVFPVRILSSVQASYFTVSSIAGSLTVILADFCFLDTFYYVYILSLHWMKLHATVLVLFRWLLPHPNSMVWMLASMPQLRPSSRLVVMVPMDTALVRL